MKIDCHAQSFHAIVGPTNVLMVSRLLLLPVWSIRLRQMPIGWRLVTVVQPTSGLQGWGELGLLDRALPVSRSPLLVSPR